jgi:septin family protein
MVMGSTNVGKSTFLNNLLGITGILITSEDRETSCFWNIKIRDPTQSQSTKVVDDKMISKIDGGAGALLEGPQFEFIASLKQTKDGGESQIKESFG